MTHPERRIRYTLLTDGSSDRVLTYIIDWALDQRCGVEFGGSFAEPRTFASESSRLSDRILPALTSYPCNILFIHRDAEREYHEARVEEISEAMNGVGVSVPSVCVVPIRMTEAWLLSDEAAIRRAAGNPNGNVVLSLPDARSLESVTDPKQVLFKALIQASELRGRRREQLFRSRYHLRQRVGELIADFSPLRALSAFRSFESELDRVLRENGWHRDSRQPG